VNRARSADWTAVRIRNPRNPVAVVNALFELGAEGVQELEDGIVTHLRDADSAAVIAALRSAEADVAIELTPTPTIDWSAAWRSRITAHRVGRIVVTPPWLADRFDAGERLIIDPGMAFGTGEHETTRGVLKLMQSVVRVGDVVADLGAGSAVLAIGAAKLGAARVAAIELDADAIDNAESNVAVNGVADRVSVIEGDAADLLPLLAPLRVVLANIIAPVLLSLLPTIAAALVPGGVAILSGILAAERSQIEDAAEVGGWRVLATEQEGIWWTVSITR
jgi:ribosomal protein L11 methyltransferase